MNKKSQVQMMETLAVLLVFFILVILGIVFYSRVLSGSIETQKEEGIQLSAVKVAQRASTLPELQCSNDNIVSDNCIDIVKLEAASDILRQNEAYYYDRFLFSNIKISEVYPENKEWKFYERPLAYGEFSNKIVTNIPISLFDPINNKNSFGVMNVELFTK